jgi:hypothetical protein
MKSSDPKSYLLTYVSCLSAYIFSFAITVSLTYRTFKDLFPNAYELHAYQEAAAVQGLLTILGAIVFSVIIFQFSVLLFSLVLLRWALKNVGFRRRATITWICVLLFFNPLMIFLEFSTGLSLFIIGAWLLILPGLGRYIATARH